MVEKKWMETKSAENVSKLQSLAAKKRTDKVLALKGRELANSRGQ